MMTLQSQATFGQGTHSLVEDNAYLTRVRSDIMRSLWKTDTYSMSPLVTMALLGPTQLDPDFGVQYEGLRTVMRCMRNPEFASKMRARFLQTPHVRLDGPTMRLQVAAQFSVLSPQVQQIMQQPIPSEGLWLHNLRGAWRQHLWRRISHERAQHYAGASCVDRERTLLWYNQLQCIAMVKRV